MNMATIKA